MTFSDVYIGVARWISDPRTPA